LFTIIMLLVSASVVAAAEKPAMTGKPAPATSQAAPAAGKSPGQEKPGKEKNAPDADLIVHLRIPLFSPRFADFPLAIVEDEAITLNDLIRALAGSHGERGEGKSAGKGQQYLVMLNRLIEMMLIAHEARVMGLDDLPEVKETIASAREEYLRDKLLDQATENLKPDDAEVEALYRSLATEYKMRSALFEKEDIARKASEEIKNGRDFDETIEAYIKNNEAKGLVTRETGTAQQYVKRRDVLPEIEQAVSGMTGSDVSPIIRIESGYVLLKLEDMRIPETEDAAAREQARQESFRRQKFKAILAFKQGLMEKYVKLNRKIFDKLDYESKDTALDKYLKDKREIAEIQGENPLTVAELTEAIKEKLYHGVKAAYENKSINEKKVVVLDEILWMRIQRKEVQAQGLDKTNETKEAFNEIEKSSLFAAFLRKVVAPDIHPREDDLKAYYASHQEEFVKPRMVKLAVLAFKKKKAAETAIERLRKGADLNWMRANTAGVVADAPQIASPSLPVFVSSLSEGLQEAIAGTKQGDYRLYDGPYDFSYVVFIAQDVPEQATPFPDVSSRIMKTVAREQINKSLQAWTAKLRDAYAVKVYLSESEH
jgi:PPIC-type PPIASE domain